MLLPKPGKPPENSSSFHLLGLLSGLGNVLEKCVLDRLNEHLGDSCNPRLSPIQYGIRRGKSTVMAIQRVVNAGRLTMSYKRTNMRDKRCLMVVLLDVKNELNTASWQAIASAPLEKIVPQGMIRIIASWFEDRLLIYDTNDGPVSRSLSAGVPQGSILGPTLWNVMDDGVFEVELPDGAELIGYADDLALLVPGRTPSEASQLASEAVNNVLDEGSSVGTSTYQDRSDDDFLHEEKS